MPEFTTETWMIVSLGVLAVASQVWDKWAVVVEWWNKATTKPTVAPKQCQEADAHDCLSALRLLKHEALENELNDPETSEGFIKNIHALAPMVLMCDTDDKPVLRNAPLYDPKEVSFNRE